MPTSGQDNDGNPTGDFGNLFGKDGLWLGLTAQEAVTNVQGSPYNFSAAGYVNNSGVYSAGGPSGFYWSSTVYANNGNVYSLHFYSNFFSPADNGNRSGGYSVRCVADY